MPRTVAEYWARPPTAVLWTRSYQRTSASILPSVWNDSLIVTWGKALHCASRAATRPEIDYPRFHPMGASSILGAVRVGESGIDELIIAHSDSFCA